MNYHWKGLCAAFGAASVTNLAGVWFVLDPISRTDSGGAALVPPAVGFFVYVFLSIALFGWVARQIRSAYKAALVIATSQFLLVNVDFVLAGKRGVMTAAASTLLLIVSWGCVAAAYSYFVGVERSGRHH